MDKDRRVIKSKRTQEKKKKKVKIQQDSESKKKPQKMKASTSAPVRANYQTRSKTKQQESSSESESEWDSDWKEFLSTYVPPREEYPSSPSDSNKLDFFFLLSHRFRPTKGERLIRLVRRGMRTGQAFFPLGIEPGIPRARP
ncbi:hypothetical protein QL285_021035 [Trifolium repens]|nr:hypothetical protein QL285_021035 [Trifolium repens]